MLKACGSYLLYILNHKLNVLVECWKEGLYVQGVVHDWSKFLPSEFFSYARKFYSGRPLSASEEAQWKYAWLLHQRRNKHHWEYWVLNPKTAEALPMPRAYVIEMVCDWRSFSRKWGRRVKDTTLDLTNKIIVHPDTLRELERLMRPREPGPENKERIS